MGKLNKKVGLKDIAERMGVSVTTVARALQGSHLTSQKTIERVAKVASEMGYVRNLDGVRLRTGQSFVIAAALKFPTNTEVGDPTLLGILQGIHDRCSQSDYSVKAVVSTSVEEDLRALETLIRTGSADAVILDYTSPQDARVKLLLERDMPFVTFGQTELFTQHPFLDIDNDFAAWQGTRALLQDGRRRIAMLDGEAHLTYVQQRVQGYQRALAEAGVPYDPSLVHHLEPDAKNARQIAHQLCQSGDIDAFLCVNDVVLIGAQAGVRDADPMLEDTVGFAVRGGTNLGSYLRNRPHISYFSRVEAGWHLGDLALRRLDGAKIEALQKVKQTELRTADQT